MTTTRRNHLRARSVAAVALSAALGLGVVACGSTADRGSGASARTATTDTTASSPATTAERRRRQRDRVLTDAERAGLLYMVEEEKLAHDVYVTLGEEWGLQTFENIPSSETTHMARVQDLLDAYGIADPTEGLGIGEFADPTFTALYDQFVARGMTSVTEALAVGAEIEELDIVDLDARMAGTEVAAIDAVYAELRSGSENHLRAFTRALDASGRELRAVPPRPARLRRRDSPQPDLEGAASARDGRSDQFDRSAQRLIAGRGAARRVRAGPPRRRGRRPIPTPRATATVPLTSAAGRSVGSWDAQVAAAQHPVQHGERGGTPRPSVRQAPPWSM